MIIQQGTLCGRWEYQGFAIEQYDDHPTIRNKAETEPHLTGIFAGRLSTSRVALALMGQAVILIEESLSGGH